MSLFFMKLDKQFLVASALRHNIHIFSFFIKAPLNARQILFIARLRKALSAMHRLRAKHLFYPPPQKQSSNLLELTNGNIPVNLFVLPKLSLRELGFLLATWEHRVFVTASLLQINPFDQFGVAAGKTAAQKFLKK